MKRMISFRGPAPLHHTLMAGRTKTAVTLQTLHHEHFDHGVILQQSPEPGLDIPNPDSCTVPQLLEFVAPKGADILVDGINKGVFVPPVEYGGWDNARKPQELIHAAKITTEDSHINWSAWTWQKVNRHSRVLGPLWNKAVVIDNRRNREPIPEQKRMIITEMEDVQPLQGCDEFSQTPGWPFVATPLSRSGQQNKALYVWTCDKKLICLRQIKVEGDQNADGARAALKARMLGDRVICTDEFEFRGFHDTIV